MMSSLVGSLRLAGRCGFRVVGRAALGVLLSATIGCRDEVHTLQVQTHPPGAQVFIDGRLAGASPCKVQWKDAQPADLWERHVIEVRAEGFPPRQKEIRYRSGAAWLPDRLELTLSSSDGLAAEAGGEPAEASRSVVWTPGRKSEIIKKSSSPAAVRSAPHPKPSRIRLPAKKNEASSAVRSAASQPAVSPGTQPAEPSFSFWRPKGRAARGSAEPPKKPSASGTNARGAGEPVSSPSSPPAKQAATSSAPANASWESAAVRAFLAAPSVRQLACEVKLVRLSDGRVLAQASLLAPTDRREEMAKILVELLARQAPPGAEVAVGCLSNRRGSPEGQALCDEMTLSLLDAVRQSSAWRFVKSVNLRDVILDEKMLESPKIVSDRRIAHLFDGADHVIVGGLAATIPLPPPVPEDSSGK